MLSQSELFPRPALVETPQREQGLTSLPPKRGLITAQPIEGIGRQVVKADEGAREIVRLISGPCCQFRAGIQTASGPVLLLPRIVLCLDGVSVHACDDIPALLMVQPSLPEVQQLPGLDLEQAA